MAIGIVTPEEFDKELSQSGRTTIPIPTPEAQIVEESRKGRTPGTPNVPDELRKEIAETALMDGRQAALELAEKFGISASSVSAYTKGATSTASYHAPDREIVSHLNKARLKATKRASKTLNQALSAITQDKLDYSDAKDLAGIAKDMSAIIKNLEPQSTPQDEGKSAPQFVVFAPQFHREEHYESITVKE